MKRIQVIMLRNKKFGATICVPKGLWDYDYYNNYFIRSFDTIEELTNYLSKGDNLDRLWRIKGLRFKEQKVLNEKLSARLTKMANALV